MKQPPCIKLPWVSRDNGLPPASRLVLAYMSGHQYHADIKWMREGFAFMVRWDDEPKYADKDGWSNERYGKALKQLGADYLEVTHWILLEKP